MVEDNTLSDYDELIRGTQLNDLSAGRRAQYNFQRWLLDDYEEITVLQNALRGVMLDQQSQQFQEVEGTRLVNDRGARVLTETYLLPIIKNAKLSNFDKDEIKDLMLSNMREITKHIYQNLSRYEIEFENLGIILDLLETYLKSVFNRAIGGAEQNRLGTTQKVISEERITAQGQQQLTPPDAGYVENNNKNMRDYLPF